MLARRSIQKLLDKSTAYLSREQRESFVHRLNATDGSAIDFEWEVIILASLAAVGSVVHEPRLGGPTRLDFRFFSPGFALIGDIRTLSDEDIHRENPIRELAAKLYRYGAMLNSEGIRGGFDFRVNGVPAAPWRGRNKARLLLPRTHEFKRTLFDKRFATLLAEIRRSPERAHRHEIQTDTTSISVVFNPGGNGMRAYTHPPYTGVHDVKRNIIYGALERKADQIKKAGARSPGELAGVVLCDGGCEVLRGTNNVGPISLNQIAHAFLADSHTVDFVVAADLRHETSIFDHFPGPLHFRARTWSVRYPETVAPLEELFNRAFDLIPAPAQATRKYSAPTAGTRRTIYSTYTGRRLMTADAIEFSLRAAMDYLAGRIDRAEFENAVHPDWLAQLRRYLDKGMSVSEIAIVPHAGEDDDGLRIAFGATDAAIGPFIAEPVDQPKPG